MSDAADPKDIIRRYYAEAYTEGIVDWLPDVASETMAKRMADTALYFRAAFSGLSSIPEFIVAEGGRVTARVTVRGTHTGEFHGIPATGRYVEIPSIDIFDFVDGRVVQHWEETNMLEALRQLTSVTVETHRPSRVRRVMRSGLALLAIGIAGGVWAGYSVADSSDEDSLAFLDDLPDTGEFNYECETARDRRNDLEGWMLQPPPSPVESTDNFRTAFAAWDAQVKEAKTRLQSAETEMATACGPGPVR